MTQHNNWKDEFDKEFLHYLKTIKVTAYHYKDKETADIAQQFYNSFPDRIKSFIDTLLIERTKACLTIVKNKGSGDRGGIGESAPIDYVNGYKYACEDIAKQITKLIETEE